MIDLAENPTSATFRTDQITPGLHCSRGRAPGFSHAGVSYELGDTCNLDVCTSLVRPRLTCGENDPSDVSTTFRGLIIQLPQLLIICRWDGRASGQQLCTAVVYNAKAHTERDNSVEVCLISIIPTLPNRNSGHPSGY